MNDTLNLVYITKNDKTFELSILKTENFFETMKADNNEMKYNKESYLLLQTC